MLLTETSVNGESVNAPWSQYTRGGERTGGAAMEMGGCVAHVSGPL